MMTEANTEVKRSLHKAGIFALTGKRLYWQDFSTAMESCQKILEGQDTAPVHHIEYKDGRVVKPEKKD